MTDNGTYLLLANLVKSQYSLNHTNLFHFKLLKFRRPETN